MPILSRTDEEVEHVTNMATLVGKEILPYAFDNDLSAELFLDALTMSALVLCSNMEEGQSLFSEWVGTLLEIEEKQMLPEKLQDE